VRFHLIFVDQIEQEGFVDRPHLDCDQVVAGEHRIGGLEPPLVDSDQQALADRQVGLGEVDDVTVLGRG